MKKILILILMAAVLLVVGCKTVEPQVEIVERVRIDTVKVIKERVDSVVVKDSVMVTVKGDTVNVERWHVRWRERVVTDTVYQARVDSVPVPYPVVKEVPAELSWWQKALMWCGLAAVIVGMIFVSSKLK